ncbi:transposase-like protein, partial [Baia soyae]
ETKLEAVKAYINGMGSYKTVAQQYQVGEDDLGKWVSLYREHGYQSLQKRFANHSVEFKMDVLNFINETGASIRRAAAVFNIPSPQTVWTWRHLCETQGIDALRSKKKGRPSMKKKSKKNQELSTEEALQERIRHLEMENDYLKKLNALVQDREKLANKTKPK